MFAGIAQTPDRTRQPRHWPPWSKSALSTAAANLYRYSAAQLSADLPAESITLLVLPQAATPPIVFDNLVFLSLLPQ